VVCETSPNSRTRVVNSVNKQAQWMKNAIGKCPNTSDLALLIVKCDRRSSVALVHAFACASQVSLRAPPYCATVQRCTLSRRHEEVAVPSQGQTVNTIGRQEMSKTRKSGAEFRGQMEHAFPLTRASPPITHKFFTLLSAALENVEYLQRWNHNVAFRGSKM
jgi:hypothetical protein